MSDSKDWQKKEQLLKQAAQELIQQLDQATEGEELIKEEVPPPPKKKQNIVIAEDDADSLAYLARIFPKTEFCVHSSRDGLEMFEFLESVKDPIVFLDLYMPKLNGMQALQKMRHDSRFKDVPVVVVSGYSDSRVIQKVSAMGVEGFLVKPVESSDLLSVVRKINKKNKKLAKKS